MSNTGIIILSYLFYNYLIKSVYPFYKSFRPRKVNLVTVTELVGRKPGRGLTPGSVTLGYTA